MKQAAIYMLKLFKIPVVMHICIHLAVCPLVKNIFVTSQSIWAVQLVEGKGRLTYWLAIG